LLHGGGYSGEGAVPTLGVIQIVERVLLLHENVLVNATFKHDSRVSAEMVAVVLQRIQEDALHMLVSAMTCIYVCERECVFVFVCECDCRGYRRMRCTCL
jgi:hypothetical protein